MRKLLLIATISFSLLCSSGARSLSSGDGKNVVILEGTILDISPILPSGGVTSSGFLARYRLVRYKVDRVCKGKYKGEEIVIDHVIENGEILKDRKVGDKVYALAWRSKKEGTVNTYKGIRDSAEGLKYLYHGGDVLPATSPLCSFDEKKLMSIQ